MRSPQTFCCCSARAATAWAVSLLWVSCNGEDLQAPETGDLVIRTVTVSPPSGLESYTVSVDGGEAMTIGVNDALTLTNLPAGDHAILLAGVPDGCALAGDNPRPAAVPADGRTEVDFDIACALPLGSLTVTTTTTGPVPDPDGYAIQLDGGAELPIAANGSLMLTDVAPGAHSLLLVGLAGNCTVEGENPRSVEAVAGTPTSVGFGITCVLVPLTFREMTSGTTADLAEVWGSSASDVFAVGEVETDGGENVAGVILHYDGTAWQPQLQEDDLRFRAVWGSSATDVYAVGFHFLSPGAVVFHYDGSAWTQTENFIGLSEELALMGVWGSSATDVFAVGVAFDGRFSLTFITHFDGTAWQRQAPPTEAVPRLNDVWGSGPSDVYAVGRDETRDPAVAVILRYDGAAWSSVLGEEGLLLNAVWGSSGTDVFAVGFSVDEDFNVATAIRHFDGAGWRAMNVPAVGVLQDVWGSSPTDVYAVGDDGVVLHYDGTEWTRDRPGRRTLLGVWGSSAADVFVVGDRGTIEHATP
jgi:hypothetical protein